MDNPKAAIDALLESTVKAGSLEVHPLTVARYALLELVDSPIVVPKEESLNVVDVVPTVYIMTQPAAKLSKYTSRSIDQLKADAFEWAEDGLTAGSVPMVIEMLAQKILDLKRLAPESISDGKKKSRRLTSNGWMTALTFWAMKTLHGVEWSKLIWDVPLNILFLWARQDQYCSNDQVITLGDKEMIDNLEKRNRQNGN